LQGAVVVAAAVVVVVVAVVVGFASLRCTIEEVTGSLKSRLVVEEAIRVTLA
jgi:hypothetical protein